MMNFTRTKFKTESSGLLFLNSFGKPEHDPALFALVLKQDQGFKNNEF